MTKSGNYFEDFVLEEDEEGNRVKKDNFTRRVFFFLGLVSNFDPEDADDAFRQLKDNVEELEEEID